MKFKVYVWYHTFSIFSETVNTVKEEYEIEASLPDNFEKRMLNCDLNGIKYDDEFRHEFYDNKLNFSKEIEKLNIKPGFVRVLIELSPGFFYVFSDSFKHKDSDFEDISSTAQI